MRALECVLLKLHELHSNSAKLPLAEIPLYYKGGSAAQWADAGMKTELPVGLKGSKLLFYKVVETV